MSSLIQSFLDDGRYLRNWSPRTAETYEKVLIEWLPEKLSKSHLNAALVQMRQQGLSFGGCNLRIRTLNSFANWAHENGHTEERLKLKLLRVNPKPVDLLTDADVRRLMSFKPKGRAQTRTHALMMLLLDTGLRIGEALSLERRHVDLDNLILRVMGKGSKERLVPFSREGRKVLFRHLKASEGRLAFCSLNGDPLSRHNVYRDINRLCTKLGIKGAVNPHAFRHAFAAG